jgi:hypothetical protein
VTPDIAKVDKPEAATFRRSRRLFLVPLVLFSHKSDPELLKKCDAYWKDVGDQIANLESKVGPVRRIYHESIVVGGEEALAAMEEFNPAAFAISKQRAAGGATVELIEDKDLAEEAMDWERCMMMGFATSKVANMVSQQYEEASRKRYEHIARRIDETLKEQESGVIFIREGHRVQFPKDIEVFIVFPPSLDTLHRWLREQAEKKDAPGDEQSC